LLGEADLPVAADIFKHGTISLSEAATHTLIVDLGGVTFMDSSAISTLIGLRNVADTHTKRLVLIEVPARVTRILAITGLDSLCDIRMSGTDANPKVAPSPCSRRHGSGNCGLRARAKDPARDLACPVDVVLHHWWSRHRLTADHQTSVGRRLLSASPATIDRTLTLIIALIDADSQSAT
jgi:anti-anti-sigma factor